MVFGCVFLLSGVAVAVQKEDAVEVSRERAKFYVPPPEEQMQDPTEAIVKLAAERPAEPAAEKKGRWKFAKRLFGSKK